MCPSRHEPFGFVLLEALDAGVPVIASDTPGPREVLSGSPSTFFPVGDVDALASLLREAYAERRGKMPQDLTACSLQIIAARTEAAYRELVARKRSAGTPAV